MIRYAYTPVMRHMNGTLCTSTTCTHVHMTKTSHTSDSKRIYALLHTNPWGGTRPNGDYAA